MLRNLVGHLLCVLVCSGLLCAQSASVSGDITGTISDPSGAVLPKVTVTAVDKETGFRRAVATDASGQFRLTGLPPAKYELSADLSGFSTEIRTAVTVSIGQTIISDFHLKVSAIPI